MQDKQEVETPRTPKREADSASQRLPVNVEEVTRARGLQVRRGGVEAGVDDGRSGGSQGEARGKPGGRPTPGKG